ncbi:MAG: hypothetical protein Fur0034_10840 [Desulfuromonadia bacterium]
MLRTISLLLILLLLLTACASQLPIPANHPLSTQKKARALHHWELLADDVARETIRSLSRHDIDRETPLFVSLPEKQSTFTSIFRKLLEAKLTRHGAVVTSDPSDAITLRYETDLVTHGSSRYTHIPATATLLTAGTWVIRDISSSSSGLVPGTLALAAAADLGAGHYAGLPTATELMVTSAILDDDVYLMKKTDIYYIEDADLSLFTTPPAPPKGREFTVTCGADPCIPGGKR